MAEHKEESVMEKISDKLHGRGGSSSPSDSDDERSSSSAAAAVKAKIYRLFGREKPVHSVLGRGKPADLLLWRNKKISGGVLAGATAIWLLFEVMSGGTVTPEQEKMFRDAFVIFVGVVISVIGDKLVDTYLHMRDVKELWEALEAKFGATDAGSELYIMKQYHDYKMADNRSVVEQAHELQYIAKELELLKCVLPDKFVVEGIIAKLPPSWRNFVTSLKHKRQEISVESLIGSLDVEEKARAKDSHTKGTDASSSANMVQKNAHKFKGKNKVSQTTNFKKKKQDKDKDPCYVCGETGHWASNCKHRKGKKFRPGQNTKSVNVTIGNNESGASGSLGIQPS